MGNEKKAKREVSLLGYDPIETPDEIISSDKDNSRKDAFREAYKKVMQIIPEYFINKQKRKKNTSGTSGGNAFTQNIIVTPENVKVETKEQVIQEEKQEDRERDD